MSNNRYNIKPQDFQRLNSRLLYISMSKFEGDWKSIPHTHHFSELFYVVSGSGTFLLDGEAYPIHANDLVIVPPNTEHTEQSPLSDPLTYIALGIEGITFLTPGPEGGNDSVICSYSRRKELLGTLNLILGEIREEQPGCQEVCQSLLKVLLIQIARKQRMIPAPINQSRMTKECGQIKRYLDANYSNNINLDTLAGMAHMNKYYLVHAFTRFTGLSPINYLNSRRLMAGKDLLSSTNHSVAQIASSIGFSSQSYFSQFFKKETGMSPNQYRKANLHSG